MIAEFGHFLLCLAAMCSLLGAVAVWAGLVKGREAAAGLWRVCTPVVALCLLAATGILLRAFLIDDFSVAYVADHSNTKLDAVYKAAALWGSHEGSMLLWILFMALGSCVAAVALHRYEAFSARIQCSMLAVIGVFSAFLLTHANPFLRNLPAVPSEGRDLNPILQDIGMILHPPVIFASYAGLAVVFAVAMAVLWMKRMTPESVSALKRTGIVTWIFLTAGNALGSWWAYTELGWGGWWFWDPVENASFIPWLAVGALLHALILYEKRARMLKTVVMLCIISFALCLLGTFIVRSGLMQSVHAFAADPERGAVLLLACIVVMIPALVLYTLRIDAVQAVDAREVSDPDAFDMALTLAVCVLCVAAAAVLVGTLYPVFYDMAGLGTLTVGAPYFNSFFAPMTLFAAVAAGGAQLLALKNAKATAAVCAVVAVACGSIAFWTDPKEPVMTFVAFACAGWLAASSVAPLVMKGFAKPAFGAVLAHAAIAVAIVGAAGIAQYEQEALVRMGPGAGKPVGDVIFVYRDTYKVNTHAYFGDAAHIEVLKASDESHLTDLFPMRQTFVSSGMQMTAAGIEHGALRDLYVSMGNKLSDTEWLVRLSVKPLASWLWLAAALMMAAGVISCVRRRKEA